jgi:hypothetical protein
MPCEKSAASTGTPAPGRRSSSAAVMSPVPQQISSTRASGLASTARNVRAARHHQNRSMFKDSR